jgi:hypothetical protein
LADDTNFVTWQGSIFVRVYISRRIIHQVTHTGRNNFWKSCRPSWYWCQYIGIDIDSFLYYQNK